MSVNDKGLIRATRGAVFYAPAETGIPTEGVKAFTLDGDQVAAGEATWQNLGHTSDDNRLAFSADGGEAETKDTWLMAGAATTYSPTMLKVAGHLLQADADSLKFLFSGWDSGDGGVIASAAKKEQSLALFVLAYDSAKATKFGIYLPKTSFTYSSDGLIDLASDSFVEFGFEAQALTSSTLPKSDDGRSGTFSFYPTEAFTAATAPAETPPVG